MPINWTDRVWREFRAGNLTRAYRDVLLTLRTFRGAGGLTCPSHATLAERARCSPSTVLRACQEARRLGLVDWAERRVRRGWRWLRTSNAYRFAVPAEPVQTAARPAARPAPSTNRQSGGGEESPSKKAVLATIFAAAAAAPDLLAARRADIESRMRMRLAGR